MQLPSNPRSQLLDTALPHVPSKVGAPLQTTRLQPPPASYDSGANRATHNPIVRLPTSQPQLPITKKNSRTACPAAHCDCGEGRSAYGPHTVQAFSIPTQTDPYQLWKRTGCAIGPTRSLPVPAAAARPCPLDPDCPPALARTHTRHATRIEGPHATADCVL